MAIVESGWNLWVRLVVVVVRRYYTDFLIYRTDLMLDLLSPMFKRVASSGCHQHKAVNSASRTPPLAHREVPRTGAPLLGLGQRIRVARDTARRAAVKISLLIQCSNAFGLFSQQNTETQIGNSAPGRRSPVWSGGGLPKIHP